MKPQRKSVALPDGSEFEFWAPPITLAQRAKAQKQSGSDDATSFALVLLSMVATDESGQKLFQPGEIVELKNELPAAVVESLLLQLLSESEEEEKEDPGEFPGAGPEVLLQQLVRRVDLPLHVVGHHHDRQQHAGDHVADDHLDEHQVSAVGDRRHADDGQCARLGGDDRHADAPPGNVPAAKEVVAGRVLVAAEPQAEGDDPGEIADNDDPVDGAEVTAHDQR